MVNGEDVVLNSVIIAGDPNGRHRKLDANGMTDYYPNDWWIDREYQPESPGRGLLIAVLSLAVSVYMLMIMLALTAIEMLIGG